jgi:molecular chaperone DnaK
MVIGIDLGTTFSAAAYMNQDDVPQIISNSNGKRLTPSVVMEDEDGTIIVGDEAKDNLVLMSDRVVSTVKDYMGTDRKFTLASGNCYTPEQISALILKKIQQDAGAALGQEIVQAVVTVPAYFNDAQRQATKDAGRIAGLQVVEMPNEPTAAALYFAWCSHITDSRVLVYDLGGGTFDVSIVEIKERRADVVATGGIRKLGGHFFDQLILNYVADYLLEKHDLDIYDDEYIDELQDLSLKAENCKIQLSSRNAATIAVRVGSVRERIEITREQFEKMIEQFYLRTESTIRMVLGDAHMTWKDIDQLLLVGGSSKIPYIRERLKEFSGMEPSQEANPDEAVALGAAIYASSFFDKIQDVCSHSLGIVSKNPKTKEKYNSIIIPRNTALPVRMSKEYYTPADNQTNIFLEVTEGEDEDLEYVTVLSGIHITLPPNTPKNTKVTVEMLLNENQLLHVYARIHTIPETYREISIERKSNLEEEEIEEQTTLIEKMTIV